MTSIRCTVCNDLTLLFENERGGCCSGKKQQRGVVVRQVGGTTTPPPPPSIEGVMDTFALALCTEGAGPEPEIEAGIWKAPKEVSQDMLRQEGSSNQAEQSS